MQYLHGRWLLGGLFFFLIVSFSAFTASDTSYSYQEPGPELLEKAARSMLNAFGGIREGAFDRTKFLALCRDKFPTSSLLAVKDGLILQLERLNAPSMLANFPEYEGTYQQYQQEQARLLAKSGERIRRKWLSPSGFVHYAQTYYPGKNVEYVYGQVAAVLDWEQETKLAQFWPLKFTGTLERYLQLRERVINSKGSIYQRWLKVVGARDYLLQYYPQLPLDAPIGRAWREVGQVLTERERQLIDHFWPASDITISKFEQLRSRLLDRKGQLLPQWQGPLGFLRYCEKFKADGDLKYHLQEALTIFDSDQRLALAMTWPQISGDLALTNTLTGLRSLLTNILDENGELKTEYLVANGLYQFVTNNKMSVAYDMEVVYRGVLEVLTQQQKEQLGKFWLPFQGSTEQYQLWRFALLDQEAQSHPRWLAPLGPYYFASAKLVPPKMSLKQVRANAMAVLSLENRKLIATNWIDFGGTVEDLRTIYEILTDDDFIPKEQCLGREGLLRAIDELKQLDGLRWGSERVIRSAFSSEMGTRAFFWDTPQAEIRTPSFQALAKEVFDPWGRLHSEYPLNESVGQENMMLEMSRIARRESPDRTNAESCDQFLRRLAK